MSEKCELFHGAVVGMGAVEWLPRVKNVKNLDIRPVGDKHPRNGHKLRLRVPLGYTRRSVCNEVDRAFYESINFLWLCHFYQNIIFPADITKFPGGFAIDNQGVYLG